MYLESAVERDKTYVLVHAMSLGICEVLPYKWLYYQESWSSLHRKVRTKAMLSDGALSS